MAGANIFPVEKVVRPNLTKPRDATFTGRYHGDQMIYSEQVPIYGPDTPVVDAAGKEVVRTRGGITRTVTHRPLLGHETREYVIEDLGNGQTPKNYDFAPDPNEIARAQAAEAASPEKMVDFMAKMQAFMQKMGLDEDDLNQLVADKSEPADEK